jgi:hypothetical protein
VAERVKASFVAVSGGIENLQADRYAGRETDESRWFCTMAAQALKDFAPEGWWEEFRTYQGIYICGPDGTCYGFTNTLLFGDLTPRKLLALLDRTIEEHKKRPPAKVEISIPKPKPPDPTISRLKVFGRVKKAGFPGIGRDQMWIFEREVKELLKSGELPRTVIARLVRFQLLDNGRNVGHPFDEDAVKKADFSTKRVDERTFSFTGEFSSEGKDFEDRVHGVEGKIQGEIVVEKTKIVRFRARAEAQVWGNVERTGAPQGRYPMVFAIVESEDTLPPLWTDISPVWTPIYARPTLAIWKDK